MARRKYIKDGNPELYTYFNDEVFKRLSPRQRSHWTLAEDITGTMDIPDEVQDFMTEPVKEVKAQEEKPKEVMEVHDFTQEQEKPEPKEKPKKETKLEKDSREFYIQQLKEMGIRFAPNSKLETLRKKYEDANSGE